MSNSPNRVRAHRIRQAEFVGGYLDGLSLEFSDGLNCIIGGRGVGKTCVLRLIRYALDHLGNASKAVEDKFAADLLPGGHVKVTVETKDGIVFKVQRAAREKPIVLDARGMPTDITTGKNGFFPADIFVQNEIERIADEPIEQLLLIDGFEPEKSRQLESHIKHLKHQLASSAHELEDLQKRVVGLRDEINKLPSLDAKLQEFEKGGDEEKASINRAHHDKALRDEESREVDDAVKFLLAKSTETIRLADELAKRQWHTPDRQGQQGPNASLLKDALKQVEERVIKIHGLLDKTKDEYSSALGKLNDLKTALHRAHTKQELEFQQLLEKHQEAQLQSHERADLLKLKNDLLAKKREYDETNQKFEKLQARRHQLFQDFVEVHQKRFALRKEIAERITAQIKPSVRVHVDQAGLSTSYQALLEKALGNAGLQPKKMAANIAGSVPPILFVEAVRKEDYETIAQHAEISLEQAKKVIQGVAGSGMLYELETVELPDAARIELRHGDEYKEAGILSKGQKCTAILPIVLLDSLNPLLIDEVEANLDNRYVYDAVVGRIRQVQDRRQLIFATHNANIPVLGSAQKIILLGSSGKNAHIIKEGAVDRLRDEIIDLLEGGRVAFEERRRRYGIK